ncbi:MAG: hypothetical protein K9L24_04635 [Spirochaetia bacterium]|nr:hypothetical protein [Spirochaetia bacterium]
MQFLVLLFLNRLLYGFGFAKRLGEKIHIFRSVCGSKASGISKMGLHLVSEKKSTSIFKPVGGTHASTSSINININIKLQALIVNVKHQASTSSISKMV